MCCDNYFWIFNFCICNKIKSSTTSLADCELVTNYLFDKNIEIVLSSPYKRTIDIVKHFVDKHNIVIKVKDYS